MQGQLKTEKFQASSLLLGGHQHCPWCWCHSRCQTSLAALTFHVSVPPWTPCFLLQQMTLKTHLPEAWLDHLWGRFLQITFVETAAQDHQVVATMTMHLEPLPLEVGHLVDVLVWR